MACRKVSKAQNALVRFDVVQIKSARLVTVFMCEHGL